jgi:hypothetical protein
MRLEKWAEISPQAALAWIATQTDPSVAKAAPRVHGAILGTLAVESPEAAVREWSALSDAATRAAALGPIVEAWSRAAPEAALRWGTEKLLASGGTIADWQSIPLQNWAAQDASAALSWIENQADDQVRRLLLHALGGVHPLGSVHALGGVSSQRVPRDRAAQLYSQIQSPALRTEFLTSHLSRWLESDPAAARAWIEESDTLTAEQRAKLLAKP